MQTAHALKQDISPVAEEQYLTFRLDGQDYGMTILKVQEIKGWDKITPIPNSPVYIKGVLNMRGVIVPVIDLRLLFGLPEAERDAFTVIIVINVGGRLSGMVVDAVNDVINVSAEQQCEPPEFEGRHNREFIKGLAQVDNKLIVLLDVERIVNPDSLDKSAIESTVVSSQ